MKMKVHLLNFIKRKQKVETSPEQTMWRLIEYMPDYYKAQQHYLNCVDFLEHKELEFALESLIALADESGHYFSEEYWLGLADCADKMNLNSKSNYCRQQIRRNENEIESKTAFGCTTVKIDDNTFICHISEKLKEERADKRRTKDKVNSIIDNDGVHFKPHGRDGYLYIVNKGKIAEIYFELGVKSLIFFISKMTNWEFPTRILLTTDDKLFIKTSIIDWATKTKNAIEFDD